MCVTAIVLVAVIAAAAMLTKRRWGSAACLLVIAAAPVAYYAHIYFKFRGHRQASILGCRSNMHNLGIVLSQYIAQHGNQFPDSLVAADAWLHDPTYFTCPMTDTQPGTMTNVDEWTDYTYVGGLSPLRVPNPPIMFCPPEHHGGEWGNILFMDGGVETVSAKEYQEFKERPWKNSGEYGWRREYAELYEKAFVRKERQQKSRAYR